jgi:hypothetical protein
MYRVVKTPRSPQFRYSLLGKRTRSSGKEFQRISRHYLKNQEIERQHEPYEKEHVYNTLRDVSFQSHSIPQYGGKDLDI